jgi:hypothetical protein
MAVAEAISISGGRMIRIQTDGMKMWDVELEPNETVSQLVQRLKTDQKFHFHGDFYQLRDTTQPGNQVMLPNEIVPDDRIFYLTGWMEPA